MIPCGGGKGLLTNLALSGLDDTGAVGPNKARGGLLLERVLDLSHILLWDALRNAHHQWDLILSSASRNKGQRWDKGQS